LLATLRNDVSWAYKEVKAMSKYTTGEIAKLCGVSVRTVQYYDSRNILVPSELSEGGRRLYSEDDLKRLRIICFLREAGIPINSIGELFAEAHPEKIISILLEQQENSLREEMLEQKKKLELVESIRQELKEIEHFSVESIGDIAYLMKSKNKLRQMRWFMVLTGIPVTALQLISIILWITQGLWWLFLIWACTAAIWGTGVSLYYFRHTAYICPECHNVFSPRLKEAFWAYHTPKVRRLSCPSCGNRGLCIEVYRDRNSKD